MTEIGTINCGMGNLTSVKNAFNHAGFACDFIEHVCDVSWYEKIVLPGVGAFR